MFNGVITFSSLVTVTHYLAHLTLNAYIQPIGHVLRLWGFTGVISTMFVYLKVSFCMSQAQLPLISQLSEFALIRTEKGNTGIDKSKTGG